MKHHEENKPDTERQIHVQAKVLKVKLKQKQKPMRISLANFVFYLFKKYLVKGLILFLITV